MENLDLNMRQAKREAGRRGGLATVKKHGREHMQKIGRAGAMVLHKRYKLEPVDLNDFALVDRETGALKARLSGLPIK